MALSDGAKFLANPGHGLEPGRDNAVTLWTAEGRKLGELPRRPGNDIPWIFLSPDAAWLAIVERKDDARFVLLTHNSPDRNSAAPVVTERCPRGHRLT